MAGQNRVGRDFFVHFLKKTTFFHFLCIKLTLLSYFWGETPSMRSKISFIKYFGEKIFILTKNLIFTSKKNIFTKENEYFPYIHIKKFKKPNIAGEHHQIGQIWVPPLLGAHRGHLNWYCRKWPFYKGKRSFSSKSTLMNLQNL